MAVLSRQGAYSPAIAIALMFALLLGGLPSLAGVTLNRADSQPAFTLDICHSPSGLNHGWECSAVPLKNSLSSFEQPFTSGAVDEPIPQLVIRESDAPDPPPPKSSR